jgi:hypothetical protein
MRRPSLLLAKAAIFMDLQRLADTTGDPGG